MKQSPCCARIAGRIVAEQANLRGLAKKAAYAAQKGRDITKLRGMIEDSKSTIRDLEKLRDDHDAEHAAEAVPA